MDERRRAIAVPESKEKVKDIPSFSDDEDITSEFEERVRTYFGLRGSSTNE